MNCRIWIRVRLVVTLVVGLLQFEVRVCPLCIVSFFFGSDLIFHCIIRRIVLTRQSCNVRRIEVIKGVALLSLNVVCFAVISFHVVSLLHDVQRGGGSWQCGDRRLEVAFARSGLAHFMLVQLLLFVHVEIIITFPESAHACLTSFTEIFVWRQTFSRIFLFDVLFLNFMCQTNHRGSLEFKPGILRDTPPAVLLGRVKHVGHRLSSLVVLGQWMTSFSPLHWTIHSIVNSTCASARNRLVLWFRTSLGNSSGWWFLLHSTFCSNLAIQCLYFILIQRKVLDVLPELIYVTGMVESCKIGWRLWLPRPVSHFAWWDVGCVGRKAAHVTALVLVLNSVLICALNIFNGWSECVYLFNTRRANGVGSGSRRLLFNPWSNCQSGLELIASVSHGTIQVLLEWETGSLALLEAFDSTSCFWGGESISLFNTSVAHIKARAAVFQIHAVSLTWHKSCSTHFGILTEWRSRRLSLKEERTLGWRGAFGDLGSSCLPSELSCSCFFRSVVCWRCLW